MTKTYAQSSIQALEIYLQEIKNGNEVRVSSKTNSIYKASWVDKLILKIDKKFFEGNQASLWRAEAKMSIINKFANECALVEPEMSNAENSRVRISLFSEWANSEFDTKTVNDVKNRFLKSVVTCSENNTNIKNFIESGVNPNEYFFKEAIEKGNGLEFAVNLSKHANSLKEKNLGLPESYIFHLTYNAQLLQKNIIFQSMSASISSNFQIGLSRSTE